MDDRIPVLQVARLIGIKAPTLAKWRCLGTGGTQGWIQISPTHVTYPRSEVERFLAARREDAHPLVSREAMQRKQLPGFTYDTKRKRTVLDGLCAEPSARCAGRQRTIEDVTRDQALEARSARSVRPVPAHALQS